jgi:hypothetical protein
LSKTRSGKKLRKKPEKRQRRSLKKPGSSKRKERKKRPNRSGKRKQPWPLPYPLLLRRKEHLLENTGLGKLKISRRFQKNISLSMNSR